MLGVRNNDCVDHDDKIHMWTTMFADILELGCYCDRHSV